MGLALSTTIYGDKVAFCGFVQSSEVDIVEAGIGDIACMNFWKKGGYKCYEIIQYSVEEEY